MNNQNTFREQGLEEIKLATLRSRISAYIVDAVLFMFPEAIISFIYLTYFVWGKEYITTGIKEYLFSQINIFGWYLWGALFIYSGVLIGRYKWTLGKRYAAMAVVRTNTFQKISYLRAFLRESIKWGLHSIPYVSFLILLVNLYLIGSTKKKQAIHDMVAGTQVIGIPESKKVKKILNLVAIILFIGAVVSFGIFYSVAKEVKVKPGEEKIISANEYIQKAEVELAEVKKYLKEDDVVEIQRHTAKALEYAILATDLEPSNPEIWFRRGNLYWEIKGISQGAEEWALKSYKKALELDPNNLIYRQKVEELADWKTYRNEEHGFEVKYPQDAEVVKSQFENTDRINLPFVSGTLLREKYLIIGIKEITSIEACSNPLGTGIIETGSVRVDDVDFKKEIGSDAGAGSLYESESYSTVKDNKCFSLSFVLHSVNPGMFDVPPLNFDREKELEIFNQILSTFRFLE